MSHHSASEELHPVGPDNPGFDPGDPNTGGLAAFVVLFVGTLVLIIAATTVYYNYARENQEDAAVAEKPSEELSAIRAREDEQLKTYGYINREKGIVQLPIERAKQLVLEEAAAGKPKYPTVAVLKKEEVAVPAPAAAAAPAAEKKAAEKK